MESVQQRLAARGTTFSSFFATYPLCCPSRATFLTGQYAHNHGVRDNQPPAGGFEAFEEVSTLATDLAAAGYRTGYYGKYLNGYADEKRGNDPLHVPPGWTDWHAITSGLYYNLELNENGRLRHYGDTSRDYSTHLITRKAARFVGQAASQPDPFFLVVAPNAPHLAGRENPPMPAPEHEHAFDGTPLPRPPAFDEEDVADKPPFVQDVPRLDDQDIDWLARVHEGRLESLLGVDDAVERLLQRLRSEGELAETLVIFTSDNGFLEGEHRLARKKVLYEESVDVPLVMRGPGIPNGAARPQLTANVDLAPTILDAAGVASDRVMDGRSLLPLAADPTTEWRQEILLENRGSEALRTPGYMYAEHPDGAIELYDLSKDPFQLRSQHADAAQRDRIEAFSRRVSRLRSCAGSTCP
jgi:arylsulfatase A-like enzyme